VQERGMSMPGIADMVGEIRKLQEENTKLKADLRGKENEINDLKERIAYLKQFKPKEKDIPIRQG
jgi:peptidoglycan hydrolase CwlO-like protein